ncbi:hypothetical protein N658DRAFT_538672 [Parathielavia hyrcaniae]|uniref:Uncharacterized protein n=1 Tax=Parathielavia hyrcaniae TaxID=113614 RepID=A0AAN6Q1X1_9PEZI|nr:hypothetical protein N658DRAFT_538672 [Parathielavia hyrcaniae]
MKPTLLPFLAATAVATDLLLPLHQYPANNGAAWSPIEQAITANPALTFKIIINPHNGPGGPGQGIDDPQYVAGTRALASHPNAQLLDRVVFPAVGRANAARTAVLVHGFHDFNGPAANLSATAEVLGLLARGVVQRGMGTAFFDTAGYHTFTDGPASIGAVAGPLRAANGV